jgi:hypothetical protein
MTEAIIQHANPFEPRSLEEALRLSDTLSKSGLVPAALRGKPADILVVLMTGRELGIGPMQAMQDINVIQGKPVYSADLMVANCKRRRDVCEYFSMVESTDTFAIYKTKRVGASEVVLKYTLDDARQEGLLGRDSWIKRPKVMLRRRCAAQLARDEHPDLVRGYDPDEAQDFAAAPNPPPPSLPREPQAPAAQQEVDVPTEPVRDEPAPEQAPTEGGLDAVEQALLAATSIKEAIHAMPKAAVNRLRYVDAYNAAIARIRDAAEKKGP